MTKSVLLVVCIFTPIYIYGQRRGVVADMDLHTPLRNVAVHTDRNHAVRTNYRGEFDVTGEFAEITFGLTGYLPLTLTREQFLKTDTVFLLPRMSELDEVVVIGKAPQPGFNMKETARQGAAAAAPPGGISFDLMQMLDFRARRYARRRKRLAKILDGYDAPTPSPDPLREAEKRVP